MWAKKKKKKKKKKLKKKKLQQGSPNTRTGAPKNKRSVLVSLLIHIRERSVIALPVLFLLEILLRQHDLSRLVSKLWVERLFAALLLIFSAFLSSAAFIIGYKHFNGKGALTAVLMRLRSRDKGREEISIVGLMAKRILEETWVASGYVASATIITVALTYLAQGAISILVLLLGTSLVVLFGLRYLLFSYRVQAGYYGSRISEAREIIEFIHQNAAELPSGTGSGGNARISHTIKTTTPESPKHSTWGIGARHA